VFLSSYHVLISLTVLSITRYKILRLKHYCRPISPPLSVATLHVYRCAHIRVHLPQRVGVWIWPSFCENVPALCVHACVPAFVRVWKPYFFYRTYVHRQYATHLYLADFDLISHTYWRRMYTVVQCMILSTLNNVIMSGDKHRYYLG